MPGPWRSVARAAGTNVYSTVLAYREEAFKGRAAPKSWADFWNVKNGSNYYLQAMDPYTYQDFFVGPYTMVRKSTDYGPSGRSVANAMGIEEQQAATAVTMPHDVKVPFRAEE